MPDYLLSQIVLQNDTEAILSTLSNKLLIIDFADEEISLKEIGQAETEVGPIMKYGTDLLAITHCNDFFISVIDMQGRIKSTIFKDSGKILKNPQYIAYKSDNNKIYIRLKCYHWCCHCCCGV